MDVKRRTYERVFDLQVFGLYPLELIVESLLDTLENSKLAVYDPTDEKAFSWLSSGPDDAVGLHDNASLSVDIREWLSVACQQIRFESELDRRLHVPSEKTVAWYRTNAREVLFPLDGEHTPFGPTAVIGEIVLTDQSIQFLMSGQADSYHRILFVLAHELVHVFEAMRVIVPAFIDWDAYWATALQHGMACEGVIERLHIHGSTLDDYGSESELSLIQEYWPSQAETWFNAFREE